MTIIDHKKNKLSDLEKAAIFLVSIGPERASEVLKGMSVDEVELFSIAMAQVKNITAEKKSAVIKEFCEAIIAKKAIDEGGLDYAHEVLKKTFGTKEALSVVSKLKEELEQRPLSIARRIPPSQLLTYIQHEHPQVIAIVLAHIEPEKAASILQDLTSDMQIDVSTRIAQMDKVSIDFIREIEAALEQRLSSLSKADVIEVGGDKGLADIINRANRSTEKTILEYFENMDSSLAEAVKQYLFVFDDIAYCLDDKAIRTLIGAVTNKEWALALKGANQDVIDVVYRNISERQQLLITEETELLGQVPLKEVEKAQKSIVQIVRKLEEEGTIRISRGDEVLV